MKTIILTLLLSSLAYAALIPSADAKSSTVTVQYVHVETYLGDWYEIAAIPQRFEQGCFCTRANYSLKSNGDIAVYNTCNKNSVTGKLSEARGYAKVADKVSNAKLRVTFFWPFFADYWIIGLDKDYRYAVVSNKEGSSFWILSRTPELAEDLFKEAWQIGINNGIDMSKVKMTEQKSCSYSNQ